MLADDLRAQTGLADAASGDTVTPDRSATQLTMHDLHDEKHNTGWALYVDNDVFTTGNVDQDYTGGFALTLSGRRAVTYRFSLQNVLNRLNALTRFQRFHQGKERFQKHSIEFGLTLFTPSDIETPHPIPDDHPYASLLFMANVQQTVIPEQRISYRSALTVGLLGLELAEQVQKGLHRAFNVQEPKGWDNQISDGGEPTAKYTLSMQKTLINKRTRKGLGNEVNTALEANLGFSTDFNVAISWRWGRILTPWWSFNPEQSDYISLGAPVINEREGGKRGEFYLLAGANVRYRLYNAILQGQFRHSEVEFSRSDLKDIIAEMWVGFTKELRSGYRLSFIARARSKEIKGPNAREPVWGGVILTKVL